MRAEKITHLRLNHRQLPINRLPCSWRRVRRKVVIHIDKMNKLKAINYLLGITFIFFYPNYIYAQNNALVSKTYFINKKLPLYEFKLILIGTDSISNQQEFEIQISTGNNNIQIISVNALDEGTNIWLVDSLMDINFDGYNDLFISSSSGSMGKNQYYDCWLFDIINKEFVFSPDLSGFCNIMVADSLKELFERRFEGCASQCYTENTYKVVNNKPFLIEREKQFYDLQTGLLRRFIEHYKDGESIFKKEVKPLER